VLYDYHGQRVNSGNATLLTLSVLHDHCQPAVGYINGGEFSASAMGAAQFNSLQISCFPLGNMTMELLAYVTDSAIIGLQLPVTNYFIHNRSIFEFRNCLPGERIVNNNCVNCSEGTYLLSYDAAITSCIACPVGAASCYGNVITLESGYWRRLPTSHAIIKCPYGDDACIGGTSTGDSLCGTGYTGVLCGACDTDYYFSSEKGGCFICSGENIFTPSVVIVLGLAFILLLFICVFIYSKIQKMNMTTAESTKDDAVEQHSSTSYWSKHSQVWQYWSKRIAIMETRLKILLVTLQVIISAGSTLKITLPDNFARFSQLSSLINFSVIDIIPISCVYHNDFVGKLMMTTLFPIILSAAIFIIFVGEVVYRRRIELQNGGSAKIAYLIFRRLKVRYFSIFLLLTYFVLPSVTTMIFKMFICENVDPNNEDSLENYYLAADYSIR
jgi:hypothetical protein